MQCSVLKMIAYVVLGNSLLQGLINKKLLASQKADEGS